jgi:hypothetical protein
MSMRILTKEEAYALALDWPRLRGVKCSLLSEHGEIVSTVPMARLCLEKVDGYVCGTALDPHFGDLPVATVVGTVVHVDDIELSRYLLQSAMKVGAAVGSITIKFDGPKRVFRLPHAR